MTWWVEWKNPASYLSWLVRDVIQLIELKVEPSFYDLIRPNGPAAIKVKITHEVMGNTLYLHRREDGAILMINTVRGDFFLWLYWKNECRPIPFTHRDLLPHLTYLHEGNFYYCWGRQLWRMNLETLQEELYHQLTPEVFSSAHVFLRHVNATFWAASYWEKKDLKIQWCSISQSPYKLITVSGAHTFLTVMNDTHLFVQYSTGSVSAIHLQTGKEDFSFTHPTECSLGDRYSRDLIWVNNSLVRITTGEELFSFPSPAAREFVYSRNHRMFRASINDGFISCYE